MILQSLDAFYLKPIRITCEVYVNFLGSFKITNTPE